MQRREFLKSAAAAGAATVLTTPERAVAGIAAEPDAAALEKLYPLGPDSKFQPGVPKGVQFQFSMDNPKYFPGTQRKIDVYIPAQYTAKTPACVWICLDRWMESLPAVFDNLIHKKEMPVTIAIGLHPGTVPSADPPQNPRFNRSFEFDSLNDALAKFITEEVILAVERQKTPADLPIRLSTDPNDRGITGASTGGIGAFTAAWQCPDQFRRVYSRIGTFVGMRGGDRYPVLVRKTEPKPLRIFLQDGDKDGWPGGLELGDWWMSNQEMERALSFAGYEVNHAWGVGNHDGYQGESILPDVLRWLWKDWPKPVEAGQTQNFAIQAIAKAGENWEAAIHDDSLTRLKMEVSFPRPGTFAEGIPGVVPPGLAHPPEPDFYTSETVLYTYSAIGAIASDHAGNIFVQNPSNGEILRLDTAGHLQLFAKVNRGDNGLAFGPDGKLYVAEVEAGKVLTIDTAGKSKVIADRIQGRRLTVTHEGNVYVTETGSHNWKDPTRNGTVWFLRPDGLYWAIADGLRGAAGISLTPDGLWLCVAEGEGNHGYNYQVLKDGTIEYGEPFYWFHMPDSATDCGALQICMDRQGWAYAATRMGIQVLDRNGRVTAISPLPNNFQAAGICFGGPDFQMLYVTTGNAIYRRKVKTTGMPSFAKPIGLPAWRAG